MRLACVKHAVSVHSEPGSNSPIEHVREPNSSQARYSVFKDQIAQHTENITIPLQVRQAPFFLF